MIFLADDFRFFLEDDFLNHRSKVNSQRGIFGGAKGQSAVIDMS